VIEEIGRPDYFCIARHLSNNHVHSSSEKEIVWATTYRCKGAALLQPVHLCRHFAD